MTNITKSLADNVILFLKRRLYICNQKRTKKLQVHTSLPKMFAPLNTRQAYDQH
ncbi:hypothetical protein ACJX0J_035536 [Zea mays]